MGFIVDISLLKRNRDFRLLFLGQFVSFIGTMITSVAAPYQIYQLTQSTIMVGLLSLVQLIPLLFTALIGGVFADRYNRKKLLIISEALLMIGCGALIWNTQLANPSLTLIFIVAAIMSAITGLHRPAFDSIIQQIIKPEDYKAMGALASFKFSFCLIVGPAIAGLMLAHHGLVFTYSVDLLTFFVSIANLLLMHQIPNPPAQEHSSILTSLHEGLIFAWKREALMGSYLVDFMAMVFSMPNALFPAMAETLGGPEVLGLLYAAPAVGALIISFFSGWTDKIQSDTKAIAIAAVCWGIAIMGLGVSSSIEWALLFLALAGAFDAISGIFRTTLWNKIIPQEFRGRLAGIEMISYLSGPKLGDTRAGFLASSLGISTAIFSGGLICIIGVVGCCVFMPKYWNYQH